MNLMYSMKIHSIFFGRSKLRLKKIKCLLKRLSTTQLRSC